MWIGCSDSRVPANEIMGLGAGEVFVHRNVANMVVGTDSNLLACLQFATERLDVDHVIVCGHYGIYRPSSLVLTIALTPTLPILANLVVDCGGVRAALKNADHGPMEQWIGNIRDVARLHYTELDAINDMVCNEIFKIFYQTFTPNCL